MKNESSWSRMRNRRGHYGRLLGREAGDAFFEFESACRKEAYSSAAVRKVLEWLVDVQPEDRLPCLRLAWLKFVEVTRKSRMVTLLVQRSLGQLEALKYRNRLTRAGLTDKERLVAETSLGETQNLLRSLDNAIEQIESASAAGDTELRKDWPKVVSKYSDPFRLPELPDVANLVVGNVPVRRPRREYITDTLRTWIYRGILGREAGTLMAEHERLSQYDVRAAEYSSHLFQWIKGMNADDRAEAACLATIKHDLIDPNSTLRLQIRKRSHMDDIRSALAAQVSEGGTDERDRRRLEPLLEDIERLIRAHDEDFPVAKASVPESTLEILLRWEAVVSLYGEP